MEIPDKFKWNLGDIYPDWETWEAAYKQLEAGIARYAAFKGTLAQGPIACLPRSASRKNSGNSRIACGISRRSATTRTSATTP